MSGSIPVAGNSFRGTFTGSLVNTGFTDKSSRPCLRLFDGYDSGMELTVRVSATRRRSATALCSGGSKSDSRLGCSPWPGWFGDHYALVDCYLIFMLDSYRGACCWVGRGIRLP